MNLNQITAELDFVSACVKSINVKAHLSKISDGNDKEFGMDIKCSKPEVHGDRKTGCLRMQVFVRIINFCGCSISMAGQLFTLSPEQRLRRCPL